jgi:hypothetical protein
MIKSLPLSSDLLLFFMRQLVGLIGLWLDACGSSWLQVGQVLSAWPRLVEEIRVGVVWASAGKSCSRQEL